jgi:tetratricopeptide (TPR) repeat protein
MKFRKQLFRPGRWVERITKLSSRPISGRSRSPLRSDRHGAQAANESLAASRTFTQRLAEHTGGAFSLVLSIILLAAIVALVVAFIKELRSDTVVLEGFSAPPDLVNRGYTPTVIAEYILDEIRSIQKGVRTTRQPRILESSTQLPDIDVAHGALSMRALVRYTRRFLALGDNSVSGDIVRNDQVLKGNIRFREKRTIQMASIERADGNIEALLKDVAHAVVQATDPYMLAAFLYDEEAKQPDHSFRQTLAAIDYVLAHPPEDDDAWGLMLLGQVLRVQNHFAEAADAYREATRRSPKIPFALDNLAQVLYFAGQLDEAARMIPAAPPNPHWTAPELRTRAWTLVIQNRFDEAYAFASAALAVSPDDVSARDALVEALTQLHRPAEALGQVEKTMSPITKTGPLDSHYVELLIATGRPREALEFAEHIVARHSDDNSAAYPIGLALAANGRYAEAAAAYKRASSMMTEYSPLLIAWGDALLRLGQSQNALDKMRSAANLDRTFGAAQAGVGRALLALGKPVDAAESFAKACELDRHDPSALRAWAQALDALNRQNEAAEKRNRADIVEQENSRSLPVTK